MKSSTLLIADDHPLMLSAMRTLLAGEFEVVGAVSDGQTLVERAETLRPHAIVLDISMPKMNGFEAARIIHDLQPEIKILFFTMRSGPDYVREAFLAGASGFLSKSCSGTELVHAVEQVLRGTQYIGIGPKPAANIEVEGGPGERNVSYRLTPRQRQVLQLVAEGMSGKLIASALRISPKTVEFHKATMIRCLGVRGTADLIRYAVENGLVGKMHPRDELDEEVPTAFTAA